MLMQWYKMLNHRNEQLSLPFDLDLMTSEEKQSFIKSAQTVLSIYSEYKIRSKYKASNTLRKGKKADCFVQYIYLTYLNEDDYQGNERKN